MFKLLFTAESEKQLAQLKKSAHLKKRYKSVCKALGLLETNPRHSGLNAHKYKNMWGANGEEMFEVYAENNTPAAYRIFWFYGPDKKQITIVAIVPHP